MSTTNPNNRDTYQVHILRKWQEQSIRSDWRFILENPKTGSRRGFACLSDMTIYLQHLTPPGKRDRSNKPT
jgi:hypothetical protein